MFSVDLYSAIQLLVKHNCPKTEWNKNVFSAKYKPHRNVIREALYFKMRVTVADDRYVEGEECQYHSGYCDVHYIFYGNMSVFFFADRNKECHGMPLPHLFGDTSNHDSCWRYDGFAPLRDLYFDMCKDLNPEKPHEDLNATCSWLHWAIMKKIYVGLTPSESSGRYDIIDIYNELPIDKIRVEK